VAMDQERYMESRCREKKKDWASRSWNGCSPLHLHTMLMRPTLSGNEGQGRQRQKDEMRGAGFDQTPSKEVLVAIDMHDAGKK
jgi:hypothetical protein